MIRKLAKPTLKGILSVCFDLQADPGKRNSYKYVAAAEEIWFANATDTGKKWVTHVQLSIVASSFSSN